VGITRRIVFPVLRIMLWAIIAAALVVIAFQGTSIAGGDALKPSAEVVEPQVAVATGSITNTVTVKGAVVADAAVAVKATLAGTVTEVLAKNSGHVASGAPILVITLETPVEPTVTANPDTGAQTTRENKPKITHETIKAPAAGSLTLTALKDQIVSVGDALGSVAPGTLSVTGTLTPDQQYRLLAAPSEAEVTLKGGPAPFTCTGLHVGAAPAQDAGTAVAPDPATGQPAEAASGSVTCAVPAAVTAFAGLGADLAVTNGSAKDALMVPVTSVQGSVQAGNVWVVLPDGTHERRAVGLGLTDGEQVQITGGLVKGEQVLQFIPVGDVAGSKPTSPGMAGSGLGG
jgi:hypothetical protein